MAVQVLVTSDGTVLDPKLPLLTADDLAAVRGDGVFETLLVRDGAAREEGPHLARLARSAAMLDLPEPDLDRWRGCIAAVVEHWVGKDDFALRLILSRGGESSGTATGYATGSPRSAPALGPPANGPRAGALARG